jgi:hypothetical protein
MHNTAAMNGTPIMKRLLTSIENESRMHRPADAPANDAPGNASIDEGDVDEALRSGDIRKIAHPEPVWRGSLELSVHTVEPAGRSRGGRKLVLGTRRPLAMLSRPNERWSLDFVSHVFTDGLLSGAGGRRRLHPRMPVPGRRHIPVGERLARELDSLIATACRV